MIDGVENNDISVTGPAFTITNPDAVQEVSIQTSNFSAEFGRAGGAVFNQVTKSGTNGIHGTANWAYTGFSLNDFLSDSTWHKIDYRLLNDTTQWTYGGNNHQQADNAVRYTYWSIDSAQEHLNGDFFHLAAYVDVKNPPSGSIDFDEFELVYRNKSLVFPSNGGRLVKAPESPGEDPARLTDGWRNGKGHVWRSAENPKAPLEFVYSFATPVTIEAVEVHQNPEWPAKDVEVSVSSDGKNYAPLAGLVLPERSDKGANFLFAIKVGISAPARFVKLAVRSGYRQERWGVGEIEVFDPSARRALRLVTTGRVAPVG